MILWFFMISVAGVRGLPEDHFVRDFASWLTSKYPPGFDEDYTSRIRTCWDNPQSFPDDVPVNRVIKVIIERFMSKPRDLSLIKTFEAYEVASTLAEKDLLSLTRLARRWAGDSEGHPIDWDLASRIMLPHLEEFYDKCPSAGLMDASCTTLQALAASSPVVTAVAITELGTSLRLNVLVKLSRLPDTLPPIVHLDIEGYKQRVEFVYEDAQISGSTIDRIYKIFDNFVRSRTYATIRDIVSDDQGHQPNLIAAYVLSYVPESSCARGETLLGDEAFDITKVVPSDQAGIACALSSGADFQAKTATLIEKTYHDDTEMVEKTKIITEYLSSIPAGTRKVLRKTLPSLGSDLFDYRRILVELCAAGPARKPLWMSTLLEVDYEGTPDLIAVARERVPQEVIEACLRGSKEKCDELSEHIQHHPLQALALALDRTMTSDLLHALELNQASSPDMLQSALVSLRTHGPVVLVHRLLDKLSSPRPFDTFFAEYFPLPPPPVVVIPVPIRPLSVEEQLIGDNPDIRTLQLYYVESNTDNLVQLLAKLQKTADPADLQSSSPLKRLAAYISINGDDEKVLVTDNSLQLTILKGLKSDMRRIGALFEVSLVVMYEDALDFVLKELNQIKLMIYHLGRLPWTERLSFYEAQESHGDPVSRSSWHPVFAEVLMQTRPSKGMLDLYFRHQGSEAFLRDRMRDRIPEGIWKACTSVSTCGVLNELIKKYIAISPLWIVVGTYPEKQEALLPRHMQGKISVIPGDGQLSLTVMMYGITARSLLNRNPIGAFWADFEKAEYATIYSAIDALGLDDKLSLLRNRQVLMEHGKIHQAWQSLVIYGPPELDLLESMEKQGVSLNDDGIAHQVVGHLNPFLLETYLAKPREHINSIWADSQKGRPFQALSLVIEKAETHGEALSTLLGVDKEKMLQVSSSLKAKEMNLTVFLETIVARQSDNFVSAINTFDPVWTPQMISRLSGMGPHERFALYGNVEYKRLLDSPERFLQKMDPPPAFADQLREGRPPLALMLDYLKETGKGDVTDLIAEQHQKVVARDMNPETPLKALAFCLYASEDQLRSIFTDQVLFENVEAIRSDSFIDQGSQEPKWTFVQVIYELLLLMAQVDDPLRYIIKEYKNFKPMIDHLSSELMSHDDRFYFYDHQEELSTSPAPKPAVVYAEILMFTRPSVALMDTFLNLGGNSDLILNKMVVPPKASILQFVIEQYSVSPVWFLLLKKMNESDIRPSLDKRLVEELRSGLLHADVFLHELIIYAQDLDDPLARFIDEYQTTHYASLLRGVSVLEPDKIRQFLVQYSYLLDPVKESSGGWLRILLIGPNIKALIELHSAGFKQETTQRLIRKALEASPGFEHCIAEPSLPACMDIRSNPVRWLALVQSSGEESAVEVGLVLGVDPNHTENIAALANAISNKNREKINLNVFLGQVLSHRVAARDAMAFYDQVWTPAVTLYVNSQQELSYEEKIKHAGSLEDPFRHIQLLLWEGLIPPLSILDSVTGHRENIISRILENEDNKQGVAAEIRGFVERCDRGNAEDCAKLYSIPSKNLLKSMFLIYDLPQVDKRTVARILVGPEYTANHPRLPDCALLSKTVNTPEAIFKRLVILKLVKKEKKPLLALLFQCKTKNAWGDVIEVGRDT